MAWDSRHVGGDSYGKTEKWGDQEDESFDLNTPHVTETIDSDGRPLKIIVEYKINEKGQRVRHTKKIKLFPKTIRVNKKVEERRKWKKFGECRDAEPGKREIGISTLGEEITLDLTEVSQRKEKKEEEESSSASLTIVCRNCGKAGHWTLKCPFGKIDKLPFGSTEPEKSFDQPPSSSSLGGPGRFQPSSLRGRIEGGDRDLGTARDRNERVETATIRVSNLSEDTRESDLSDLFRRFGPISRLFLAKDKKTGLSKGFAFISFVYRDDAARAIEKLSGFAYDNLILHVEWAKPSTK